MSPERLTVPRGVVALRVVPAHAAGTAAAPVCVPLPPFEIKEIQRRAFERGQAVAHAALDAQLGKLMAALDRAVADLGAARLRDHAELESFGVELAMTVAAQVVGEAVRTGACDVRALAMSVIEEALPGLGAGEVRLLVNPEDLASLGAFASSRDSREGRIRVAADPDVGRGGCRLEAAGAEVIADPKARLAAIAERLRAVAAEKHDA